MELDVREILTQIDDGIRYRAKYRENAGVYWKLYYSKHWPLDTPKEASKPVLNYCKAAAETRLAHLTASRPRLVCLPRTPDDADLARVRTAVFDYWNETIPLSSRWSQAQKEAIVTGTGILFIGGVYDRLPEIKVIEPHRFVVQPGASNLEDADWVAQIDVMTRNAAKRYFAKVKDTQAQEAIDQAPTLPAQDAYTFADAFITSNPTITSFMITKADLSGSFLHEPVGSIGQTHTQEEILVVHYWHRDGEDLWLHRIVGEKVVSSEKNPFGATLSAKELPYVLFHLYPDTKTVWPNGLLADISSMQSYINLREQALLDILRLTGNPIFLIPTDSGIKERNVTARPGMCLRYIYPFRPEWLTPNLNTVASLFSTQQGDIARINDITGQVDVLRGALPPGVESGVAISRLSSLASSRIQLEASWMGDSLRRMGKLLLARMSKFMGERDYIRIMGEGEGQEFTALNTAGFNSLKDPAEFDVSVEFSSTKEEDRERMFQRAFLLFQANALDIETLLKFSGFPEWKRLARMRQQAMQEASMLQQAQMQQQMMAAQQGQPPIQE